MRIVAIIQARMGSSRFPGKTLKQLLGYTLLEWVVRRTKSATLINDVIVATTENSEDDEIDAWCLQRNICCVRGSQEDVLSRYHKAALKHHADIIVRVTADDPLKSPELIDDSIRMLLESKADYCSNTITPTYPEGLDIEVFTFEALKKAYIEANLLSEREHVTPYIWKNTNKFKVIEFCYSHDLSSWRWTIDRPEDLESIEEILYKVGGDINISHENLINTLLINEQIRNLCINKAIRNEGYLKSIKMEKDK